MKTWRERALEARKQKRITLDLLAEQMEMSTPGIQKWLDGTRQPSVEDIIKIAGVLQVSPVWLIHGLEPEDTLDGIRGTARTTLQRLIQAERLTSLPDAFWNTIQSVADLSLPATATAKVPGIAGEVLAKQLTVESREIHPGSIKA